MFVGEGVVNDDAFRATIEKSFGDDFATGDTTDEFGVKDEGAGLSISGDCRDAKFRREDTLTGEVQNRESIASCICSPMSNSYQRRGGGVR